MLTTILGATVTAAFLPPQRALHERTVRPTKRRGLAGRPLHTAPTPRRSRPLAPACAPLPTFKGSESPLPFFLVLRALAYHEESRSSAS